MEHVPKVSVVMPVYNNEKYLRIAIASILNQTFKDFEFIVINDGSTDGTREILESYNDSRIVLIHQENIGLTKSLNKGIALAKGEYIARQDADDISMPERLEKQIEFLESHNNLALIGTAVKIIDGRGAYIHTRKYPCDYSSIQKIIKQDNLFCHGSVIFKRQSFFEVGGYREIFFTTQDYDLWLRFVENFEAANLSTPLYIRRLSVHSFTYKKIAVQRRMGIFARRLAFAREKGISEKALTKDLQQFLETPLSSFEKKAIFRRYNYWSFLLLRQHKKNDAFTLMAEGVKYHPSNLYKLLFRIIKIFQISVLLKILIRLRFLFFVGK